MGASYAASCRCSNDKNLNEPEAEMDFTKQKNMDTIAEETDAENDFQINNQKYYKKPMTANPLRLNHIKQDYSNNVNNFNNLDYDEEDNVIKNDIKPHALKVSNGHNYNNNNISSENMHYMTDTKNNSNINHINNSHNSNTNGFVESNNSIYNNNQYKNNINNTNENNNIHNSKIHSMKVANNNNNKNNISQNNYINNMKKGGDVNFRIQYEDNNNSLDNNNNDDNNNNNINKDEMLFNDVDNNTNLNNNNNNNNNNHYEQNNNNYNNNYEQNNNNNNNYNNYNQNNNIDSPNSNTKSINKKIHFKHNNNSENKSQNTMISLNKSHISTRKKHESDYSLVNIIYEDERPLIKIENIIPLKRLNNLDDEEIIMQGYLSKYNYQISKEYKHNTSYSDRFCILTKKDLKIYKTKETYLHLFPPMFIIDNDSIDHVERVRILEKRKEKLNHFCIVYNYRKDYYNDNNNNNTNINQFYKEIIKRHKHTKADIDQNMFIFGFKDEIFIEKWLAIFDYIVKKREKEVGDVFMLNEFNSGNEDNNYDDEGDNDNNNEIKSDNIANNNNNNEY